MLSSRLILLKNSHVIIRYQGQVRHNFKWDNYKNSIDIIESFGKLAKPQRMSNPEASNKRVNKHIVESIKTRVFDPSSKVPHIALNKRLKVDETPAAVEGKRNVGSSQQMAIRIISNGYGTRIKSFLLVTNTGNYLVNAGEGWQLDFYK